MVGTEKEADAASGRFVKNRRAKYGKAVDRRGNDREGPVAFYDFLAGRRNTSGRWTRRERVRHRSRPTGRTRGRTGRKAALSMGCRLMMSAKRGWRKLPAPDRFPEVIRGAVSVDGIMRESAAA